uniref:DUF685 domain-containing protein n=1 Tax=Borreliella yangtzensis TaxID=683292 RepID=UPI003B2253E8
MAGDQEKLLIDEQETVQIKDLNKVTTVENDHLLLIDDGVASCNAITFKNFLETAKDKTFKGEGLDYFKEIIKSTIAEELAADTSFVKKIYDQTLDKLIGNDSDKLSSLFSKIKSRLSGSISSSTLSENDSLLTIYPFSDNIQKTPVPKQLLGVSSRFSFGGRSNSNIIYPYEYESRKLVIDLENYQEATLVCHKDLNDKSFYLDIELDVKHHYNGERRLYLKYSDESDRILVYSHKSYSDIESRIPLYKGWYIQKKSYKSGSNVPYIMKV